MQAQHRAAKPMNRSLPQKAMRKLVQECRINKVVSLHSLRHSFATQGELWEADLREMRPDPGIKIHNGKILSIFQRLFSSVAQHGRGF
ncbi:site-specific integrase [Endozoicomonas euniceicola]|uniref:Tyrosine-type recombinase/integrase n=1 Tax=Endozoicomonas euniceicola TaxID=1234143 RepID=A0ABY6GN01_9GAMM|nr:tyrosine-type recombinase/integrase [Endozoicomonas euniceicola]UYM14114.1 tyrosine-type recombinase/integrase [Endozoicomonas euniceicola]